MPPPKPGRTTESHNNISRHDISESIKNKQMHCMRLLKAKVQYEGISISQWVVCFFSLEPC